MRSRPRPKRYVRKLESRKPCVHGQSGIELRPYQVIMKPLVTEKGTHQAARYNAHAFMVNMTADKIEIAAAIEELFNVRVERVRTMICKGKFTRVRQVEGKLANWKKAIVTLHADDKIEFI